MGRAHEQTQRVSLAYVLVFLVVNADGHRYGISCHLQSDFPLVVDDTNGQGTCTGTGLAYVLLFLVTDANGQQGTGTAPSGPEFPLRRSGFPVVDANGHGTGTSTGTEVTATYALIFL